jgi:hypothetical protein
MQSKYFDLLGDWYYQLVTALSENNETVRIILPLLVEYDLRGTPGRLFLHPFSMKGIK